MNYMRWVFGSCLLFILLYSSSVFAQDDEDVFQINQKAIQDTYDSTAILTFHVPEEAKDDVKLFRYEEDKEKIEINEITWEYEAEEWYGSVAIEDGIHLYYELIYKDSSYQTIAFTKDSKAPVVTWYTNGEEVNQLKAGYVSAQELLIRFADQHLEDVEVKVWQASQRVAVIWNEQHTSATALLTKGRYEIEVDAKDTFQHVYQQNRQVIIDDVAPLVSILGNKQPISSTPYASDVTLEMSIEEAYMDEGASYVMLDQEKVEITWETNNNKQKTTLLVSTEGKHELHYFIKDISGNICTQKISFVIDTTAPQLLFFINEEQVENIATYYDHHLQVNTLMMDESLDPKHSWLYLDHEKVAFHTNLYIEEGVHQFTWQIKDLAGNTYEDQVTFTIDTQAPLITLTRKQQDYYVKETQTAEVKVSDLTINDVEVLGKKDGQPYPITVKWDKKSKDWITALSLTQEGLYEIEIKAQDHAGHRKDAKLRFLIDKTKPIVTIEDTYQQPISQDRSLQIKMMDPLIDQAQCFIEIQKDHQHYLSLTNWDVIDKGLYLHKKFQEEGEYEVSWYGVDRSGNISQGSKFFVIDRKNPLIEIGKGVPAYVCQDINISYQIKDLHLKDSSITVYRNGVLLDEKQFLVKNQIVLTAKDHTAVSYDMYIVARDLAGNTTTAKKSVMVDKIAPLLHIFIDGQAAKKVSYVTNKDVDLRASIIERYGDECLIQLKRAQKVIQTSHDTSVRWIIKAEDDKEVPYELEVWAKDKAGNVSHEQLSFLIDRYLPSLFIANDVFHGSPYAGKWKPIVAKQQTDFQIVHASLWRNGKLIPYHYPDEIIEDGSYELQILVRDRAMNMGQLYQPFLFTIDTIAPQILIYDVDHQVFIEDRAIQGSHIKVYLAQQDRDKCKEERFLSIEVNHQPYQGRILYDEDQQPYIMVELNDELRLDIVAIDAAGNKASIHQDVYPASFQSMKNEIERQQKQNDTTYLPETEKSSMLVAASLMMGLLMLMGIVYGWRKIYRKHHC